MTGTKIMPAIIHAMNPGLNKDAKSATHNPIVKKTKKNKYKKTYNITFKSNCPANCFPT